MSSLNLKLFLQFCLPERGKKGIPMKCKRNKNIGFNIQSSILVSLPPLGSSLDYTPELQPVTGRHFASLQGHNEFSQQKMGPLPGRRLSQRKFQSRTCRSSFTLCLTVRAKCGKEDIKGSDRCQTFTGRTLKGRGEQVVFVLLLLGRQSSLVGVVGI